MSRSSNRASTNRRQSYNRVSSSHEEEEEGNGSDVSIELAQPSRIVNRTALRRQPYSRVSSNGDDADDSDERTDMTSVNSGNSGNTGNSNRPTSRSSSRLTTSDNDTVDTEDHDDDDGTRITVTILDFAQKKFSVSVNPSNTTVARFKQVSAAVHKVPVNLQRLIFRGKLLNDTKTLEESGVTEEGMIIHLFPKPRVVISDNNESTNAASTTTSTTEIPSGDATDEDANGARVPTIVLDPEEAERRSQILVLGSVDYIEAQNNVKLFSFMLLIISSIELLNLLAVALGVPQDPSQQEGSITPPRDITDDIFVDTDDTAVSPSSNHTSNYNNPEMQPNFLYTSWGWPNNVDLVLSIAGVYVALIGIQASNENTLRLARVYLIGTVLVGIGWLLFNYFVTVRIDMTIEQDHRDNHPNDDLIPDMDNADIYRSALTVMILPGLVWFMCCLRALQFHHLLNEAEMEAESRIREELERSGNGPQPQDEELALQNESATIS